LKAGHSHALLPPLFDALAANDERITDFFVARTAYSREAFAAELQTEDPPPGTDRA